MTDLIPAELLEKGAAYIEEHGLFQGDLWPGYTNPTDPRAYLVDRQTALVRGLPVCAMGALKIVALSDADGPWRPDSANAVMALGDHLNDSIPHWNDTPGRTAAEVADAMRACATNLRGA